jgi:hypothetical protein
MVRFTTIKQFKVGDHRLLKKIIPLLFIFTIWMVTSVRAQESPSLETMAIDLWPEYDDPGVLVIYKAVLSPQVSLPVEVTFRIPVQASKPSAVAVGPDPSSIADVVYDMQVMGDWIDVSFIATTPTIQFEYYDPRLVRDGAQRTFMYEWPGDLAVNSLVTQVQHPIGASSVSVTPAAGRVVQGSDGFTYNNIDVGALQAGIPFDLNLSYQKDSDALSIQSLQIQPSATLTPGSVGMLNLGQWWVWLLVILGVVLIGGGGYWYWRLGQQETPANPRRRRRAPRQESAGVLPQDAIYCHQCGKRAGEGDHFCRSCGTRLRTE